MTKNLIRDRRLALGLTMKELADRVGVAEATVSRWEAGDIANMRRDRIYKLAKALDVSPLLLLGYDDVSEEKQPSVSEGLSEDELMLIQAYRALPADERQHVLSLLRLAAGQDQTAQASV